MGIEQQQEGSVANVAAAFVLLLDGIAV